MLGCLNQRFSLLGSAMRSRHRDQLSSLEAADELLGDGHLLGVLQPLTIASHDLTMNKHPMDGRSSQDAWPQQHDRRYGQEQGVFVAI